jgi:lipopolysaccharide transport system ATP-binding protein
MSDDIVIKVENLSKYYRLGVINNGTLFRDIQSWMARKRGKEDPHAKIGSKYDPTAEGFWALKDLNFEIKKGDRIGIIGHNGAGKSTLLKLLSQITSPTEGNIKIRGRIASLLEVGTGFHPELTGRENIYMNGAILGMSHSEIDKKVNDIIEFSEIGEHIDTPVKRYSSGMYVRLAFAVAAHLDSEILIADEVLAVGDAAFQKKALGKMNELSSGQGRTVLFVSHNMAQVKNLCNKGIVLEKGQIIKTGDIDECIHFYLTDSIGMSLSSFKVFPEDESKTFQVKSVFMQDEEGNNLSTFEAQKPICIHIDTIYRAKDSGLYGYFAIYNSDRQPVIIFDSDECKEGSMSNIEIGEHSIDISLRPGSLSNGTYTVYMNFASKYNLKQFDVDSPLDVCTFSVTDTLSPRGNSRGSIQSYIPEIIVK